MGRLRPIATVVAAFAALAMPAQAIEGDTVILQGLDKVTARVLTFEAPIDRAVRFGALYIVIRTCNRTPPEEPPESAAYLDIYEVRAGEQPIDLFHSFDAVNRAKQNKERVVNDAKGERNDVIPEARGKRDQLILEAEGYALRKVKEANGRANAFLSQLLEYEKAPAITKTRLYIEAMEAVLQQVDEKIIIDETIEGVLPLLHLGDTKGGAR